MCPALPCVGSHLLPGLGEVLVQRRQRDVGQQRGEDPALWGAGDRPLKATLLGQDPGVEERLDERQHALVFDPVAHAVHQGRVVDPVKARLDVGLDHPLICAGSEVVHLGDRVLRPASRSEPVGARLEVGLEDRLQHQLKGGLNDAIGHGRDPEATAFAAALRDRPLPDRHRPVAPTLELLAQLGEELLHAHHLLDVVARLAIHTGRA
jgi:hypothetical protein